MYENEWTQIYENLEKIFSNGSPTDEELNHNIDIINMYIAGEFLKKMMNYTHKYGVIED